MEAMATAARQAAREPAHRPAGHGTSQKMKQTNARTIDRSYSSEGYYGHYKKVNVFRGWEKWLKGLKSYYSL
jgi:hypothetical protein